MEKRVQNDLCTLFPRHGIRPLAGWSTIASPVSPAFIYLTPWRTMNERSASWANFYSDPQWTEVRERTNAGSELVQSYEIMFARAVTPWAVPSEQPSFVELVIQSTAIGKTNAVLDQLTESVLPILKGEGASVLGVFDLISGRPLPALVFFIGWDSLEQRSAARARLEARSHGNSALFLRAEEHLMRHVPIDWA
jgi:NIPSNAP